MPNTNKYIIKSLAPWMIDELMVFSEFTSYDLIFLRKQEEFYKEEIKKLADNGVKIYIKPSSLKGLLKKIVTTFNFLFLNVDKFKFNYNGVIGFKSIWWFLKLDISLFSHSSNIHSQFATQPTLISFLIKQYYNGKPKYSFTYHAYDIYFKNKWLDLLVKESFKVFSISEFNINYLKKEYNIQSNKIELSRLGVFRDSIENLPKRKNKETMNLGLMSWFTEKKGIIYLLRALKELRQKGYDKIRLKLAGDGPLKNEFLEFIKKNELTGSIDFVGKVKGDQKEQFYNSIDVFILPSIVLKDDQDGIPVVLMEAIAYGLPIISTDVSGIPEICIDNFNGFLIKEKDVNAIIESIISMYKHSDKRLYFFKNSIKMSKKYDIRLNSLEKVNLLKWKSHSDNLKNQNKNNLYVF